MKAYMSSPKTLLVVMGLASFVAGCKREPESPTPNPAPNQTVEQELGDKEVAILDSLPHVNLTSADILLPNGQTLKSYIAAHDTGQFQHRTAAAPLLSLTQRKTEVLAQMASRALELTQFKPYPADADGPAQDSGLGYVFGSSQITKRSSSTYPLTPCSQKLYGLDCSGYVYLVAKAASINIGTGSENQSIPDNWRQALKAAYPVEFANVQVIELPGSTTSDKLLSGDIVIFKRSNRINHIGIILKNSNTGDLILFNSYGKGNERCDQNYNFYKSRFAPFTNIKKGPTQVSILVKKGYQSIENFLGPETAVSKVLRIKGENGIQEVSAKNHTANVLKPLPEPIIILVTDEDGKPIVGKQVQFAVSRGQVSAQSQTTDAKGQAQTNWTLGAPAGPQTLTATAILGQISNPTVTILATATTTSQPPISIEGTTYSLISWRFAAAGGYVNLATCNNPPYLSYVQHKILTFSNNTYTITNTRLDGTKYTDGPFKYSTETYYADSLFLTEGTNANCTNLYGHQYHEGWGVKIPPGYNLLLGEYWPTRISLDGRQIYRAQTGDEIYTKQ